MSKSFSRPNIPELTSYIRADGSFDPSKLVVSVQDKLNKLPQEQTRPGLYNLNTPGNPFVLHDIYQDDDYTQTSLGVVWGKISEPHDSARITLERLGSRVLESTLEINVISPLDENDSWEATFHGRDDWRFRELPGYNSRTSIGPSYNFTPTEEGLGRLQEVGRNFFLVFNDI